MAKAFPLGFLGPRTVVATTPCGSKSFDLKVTGSETGLALLELLVHAGFDNDLAHARLIWDLKDLCSDDVADTTLDHWAIPANAEIMIVHRFDFELSLQGGAGDEE